jgi:hypothetical protein
VIVPEQKLIFVHIQKTGGTWVTRSFGRPPSLAEKHFLAIDLRRLYGEDAWRSHFKFSFVRNPWDRLVSWWSMIDGNRAALVSGARLNEFQVMVLSGALTFREFLLQCDREVIESEGPKWIFRNQLEYLSDESGTLMVDFVGRFEHLASDFGEAMRLAQAHPPVVIPVHRNPRSDYRTFYDDALAELVAVKYQADIEAFGYSFD